MLNVNISCPKDVRAAAFEKNGQFTLLVEANNSGNRRCEISLPGFENKALYRYSYNIDNGAVSETLDFPLEKVEIKNGIIAQSIGWCLAKMSANPHGKGGERNRKRVQLLPA